MKKIISVICSGAIAIASMTFSGTSTLAETEHHDNVLIAYFSRAGENYSVGVIEKGNTELLAEIVAEEAGGDLFKIEPVQEYPAGYEECKDVATQERTENARPEIKNTIENFDSYDVIFVGYPIWWGDMPMIMYSFLESYDFSGKTIIPFNTHEGSGQAGTVTSIREECPDADVLNGFSVRGSVAQNNGESSRAVVQSWLESNNFESLIQSQTKTQYTISDIRNLQDFLLKRPVDIPEGADYDLDGNGIWNVFDLCLMKQTYLKNTEVDATSSATEDVPTMKVMINGTEFETVLDSNVTVDEITSELPLDLTLVRYAGHEYYAELPYTPVFAEERTSHIEAGHIYYWDGWNAFVINYEDYDISPYKVVHIGEITDPSVSDMLRNAENEIAVKVEK